MKGRSQKITTAPNGAFTIPELPSGEYASCVTVPKTDYVDDCLWGLNFPPQIVPGVAATPGQAAKAPQLITDVPYGSAKLNLATTSANTNQQLTVRKGARLIFQFPDPNKVIDKNTHLVVGALGPGNLMIPATQTPGGTLTYELLIPFDTAVNVMISSLDLQATGPNGTVNFQTGYFAPFKVTRTTKIPITTIFTISGRKGK